MREDQITLEDCVIAMARILKIPEKLIAEAIQESFENTSDENDILLDDLYWEFQDDNFKNDDIN